MSKAVSRVMSWMIIYLDISLPICSSNLPESWRATICFLLGLASSGVYTDPRCYHRSGSLLHYHFILTSKLAVLFLLHFPGSHLHRPLAGTLPYEARTFLSRSLSALRQRPSVLLGIYYTILLPVCQLTNFPVTH